MSAKQIAIDALESAIDLLEKQLETLKAKLENIKEIEVHTADDGGGLPPDPTHPK